MPTVYGELEIDCPATQVYAYLRDRYKAHVFRSVCMMAKGYVPDIHCVEERDNERIAFSVAARDSLLHFKTGSWTWTYDLTRLESGRTKVAITYRWGILLALLSMFTVRHQAANEVVETAMALDALAANKELKATR
jgi:hypothetical protein